MNTGTSVMIVLIVTNVILDHFIYIITSVIKDFTASSIPASWPEDFSRKLSVSEFK